MDGDEGSIRARNYRGIRISARARGARHSPDVSIMFVNLATTLVLLNFPKTFVYLVATLLLGHTSRVIRRVLVQRWSASDECAALGMKMLASHSAFDHLKDTGDSISKQQMKVQFSQILSNRSDLDEQEQESFIEFLDKAIHRSVKPKTSHSTQDGYLKAMWGGLKEYLELDDPSKKKGMEQVSFEAADQTGKLVTVNADYVNNQLTDLAQDEDLSRYIL